jgi:ankyrin repeat protein
MKTTYILAAGLAVAAAGAAHAQTISDLQAKVWRYMEKCQVDPLRTELQITPAVVLNAPTPEGITFIAKASQTKCDEGIELMILAGADPNATDAQGRTPLHAAAEKSTEKVVKMLVDRGAKVDAVTKSGETVLQAAARNNFNGKTDEQKKIVRFLMSKGAK